MLLHLGRLTGHFGTEVTLGNRKFRCFFPGSQAVWARVKGAVTASCPLLSPLPLHGLGRLGPLACHFLHAAAALIENLGGLAYLFSWNAAGYIFMAFSQQCGGSVSNYSKKKSQCRSAAGAGDRLRVSRASAVGPDACCSPRLPSPFSVLRDSSPPETR